MADFDPRKPGNESWAPIWSGLEIFCVIMFSLDFATRFVGSILSGMFREFYEDPMNFVDFFAILPFYVGLFLDNLMDLRFMRVLRLSRILRALKSPRFANMATIINQIVGDSAAAMTVPVYFMFLAMIMLSFLVYIAEEDENGGPDGEFKHVGYSFWWCVSTFTTVGYGDLNPESQIGQWVASLAMLVGLFFLAMPLSIVGGSFHIAWTELQSRDVREEAHTNLEQMTPEDRDVIVDDAAFLKHNLTGHLTRIKMLVGVCEEIAPGGDHWEDLSNRLEEINLKFAGCYDIYLEDFDDPVDEELDVALNLRKQKSADSKAEWDVTGTE